MLNFMGIGAQKCGTTWLYKTLSMHPEIRFPGGKEIHFWDKHEQLIPQNYINIFINNEYVNGDITPAYSCISRDVIQQIYQLYPTLPLIYIIRNPIERAWSSARMALSRAEMQANEASDQWFIDHFNSQASLLRGDYEACIKNWRSVFPLGQLKILHFEHIKHKPVELANECLQHIGLGNYFTKEQMPVLSEKVFSGQPLELRDSLAKHLHNLYINKIKSLSDYLETDLNYWLENYK